MSEFLNGIDAVKGHLEARGRRVIPDYGGLTYTIQMGSWGHTVVVVSWVAKSKWVTVDVPLPLEYGERQRNALLVTIALINSSLGVQGFAVRGRSVRFETVVRLNHDGTCPSSALDRALATAEQVALLFCPDFVGLQKSTNVAMPPVPVVAASPPLTGDFDHVFSSDVVPARAFADEQMCAAALAVRTHYRQLELDSTGQLAPSAAPVLDDDALTLAHQMVRIGTFGDNDLRQLGLTPQGTPVERPPALPMVVAQLRWIEHQRKAP